MPTTRLTATNVDKLKLEAGEDRTDYWDSVMPGFGVRVGKHKRRPRVYMVRYYFDGPKGREKRREFLGLVGDVDLAAVRETADALLTKAARGIDPRALPADPQPTPAALTFAELADAFIAAKREAGLRSWKDYEIRIKRDDFDDIRDKLAGAVTDEDIENIIDKMKARGVTVGASRTFETVRAVYNWGLREAPKRVRKHLTKNPTEGMKSPFETGARNRFLTAAEIKRLWAELRDGEATSPAIVGVLRLMLLTGQRHGEIRRMQWADLDLEGGWWNAPGERTKTGKPYRVALSERALATIAGQQGRHDTYVFPAKQAKSHLSPFDLNTWMQDARDRAKLADFVPHDIRHTVATNLAAMEVPEEVIARILNHTPAHRMTARYNEHRYDTEKRAALDAWERRLLEIVGEVTAERKVIELRAAS